MRPYGHMPHWQSLQTTVFRGLAPSPFHVSLTLRYTVLRFLSYATDYLNGDIQSTGRLPGIAGLNPAQCDSSSPRIQAARRAHGSGRPGPTAGAEGSSDKHQLDSFTAVASSSWTAFLSYMFFAPLYLAGPLLAAQDYYQQVASLAGRSSGSSSTTKCSNPGMTVAAAAQHPRWTMELMRLLGLIGIVEAARHTFYAPDMVLPHYQNLWPWQVWFATLSLLAAIWLQSVVPWTIARLAARTLGILTVDEAPVSFVAASVSARTFWRNFHVSWYRWLVRYVYRPLGGGWRAATAVMLVSTLLHGFSRVPGYITGGLNQALAMASMVVLLPLPSWSTFLWFNVVNVPMCILNSVRLKGSDYAAAPQRRPFGKLAGMPLPLSSGKLL
ncbi:hypothetical protein N2152v2_001222 [Parachlorella kessleri]